MPIEKIEMINFRNHKNMVIDFSPGINFILKSLLINNVASSDIIFLNSAYKFFLSLKEKFRIGHQITLVFVRSL